MKDVKASLLTIVQYVSLAVMMWKMPWFNSSCKILLGIEILGFIIAFLGLYEMKKSSKINISPTPLKGAFLVRTGIYSIIRHPMYTSLLLIFTPVLISNYNLFNLVVFVIFAVNLILKLSYEEILLKQFFKDYKAYSETTKRIIPFIF